MKVQVHPADEGGCGRYRVTWPAEALRAQGYDVATTGTLLTRGVDIGGRKVPHSVDTDADVIVLQRPMAHEIHELIPILQRQGVAVVVEIDDDFHALPKGHPARRETSAMANPERNRGWLRRACERADLVTCSTPALAERYAPHGRAIVLENCVPESYLSIEHLPHDGPPIIGWTGSTVTHVDDLRVCGDGVARAMDATGARLHIIGTGHGVREQLELGERPYSSSGWVSIDRYPHEYAGLDVALCPLQLNEFNRAKSWLKPLEALALGVLPICSPTDEYQRLGEIARCVGRGALATSPNGFARAIAAAFDYIDVEARAERRYSVAEWTYETRAWRWWEAWDQARMNREARAA